MAKTRFIALLRGVNVGGNKKVPMAKLRELVEELGYTEVATLLQSGNVVFTSSKKKTEAQVRKELETSILKAFGFEVSVIVRTDTELAQAIEANPLAGAEDDPSKFLVTFLSGTPDPARFRELDPDQYKPDECKLVGREIYARFPNGIRDSKLAVLLGSAKLGVVPTARNWTTVTKLLALARDDEKA